MFKYNWLEFEAYWRPYMIIASQDKLYFCKRKNGEWDKKKLYPVDKTTDKKYILAISAKIDNEWLEEFFWAKIFK